MSVAGILPWQVADNATAAKACGAAGKRLCAENEWRLACEGPDGTDYCYRNSHEPTTCNGIDTFGRASFHLAPTGSFPKCTNEWGLFDINGNLWEHVAGGSGMTVRGGAFNCNDSATPHRCDYVPGNWTPSALGCRCCLTPSGQPEGGDAGIADVEEGGDVAAENRVETAPAAGEGAAVASTTEEGARGTMWRRGPGPRTGPMEGSRALTRPSAMSRAGTTKRTATTEAFLASKRVPKARSRPVHPTWHRSARSVWIATSFATGCDRDQRRQRRERGTQPGRGSALLRESDVGSRARQVPGRVPSRGQAFVYVGRMARHLARSPAVDLRVRQ